MGRRIRNNYRIKTSGVTGEFFTVDLRFLKSMGDAKDGELKEFDPPKYFCGLVLADLRHGERHFNRLIIRGHGVLQIIALESRPTNFGGRRWYMLDENSRRCEVLYLLGKYYGSRAAVGATYVSQSEPRWSRQLLKRIKLGEKLKGTGLYGPARGENRRRLQAQYDRMAHQTRHADVDVTYYADHGTPSMRRRTALKRILQMRQPILLYRGFGQGPSFFVAGTFGHLMLF